jgi:hypothetical protein
VVEGLTFLINSSNFADDIVLYCVCIRPGGSAGSTKKLEDGQKGLVVPWPWRTLVE